MHEMLIRINELAGKRKKEGLTQVENDELVILRSQYIQKFRGSMEELLLNTTVIDPIGDDVTPEKLKSAQRKQNVKPIW
ncbi:MULTISPECIES: DUF896 domain-containing protein [unclassified Cytobacillus]|uniref:DUF896 domain-containing protein n=1 Tax=unclassified Cytobacillus TaxID=2675268 RepID=UPI001356AA78|nr:DUF896 domain-containing protein [Cytobacillus sp. AMY 15.2]KAF0818178.1 hypothetical protein KIS4809_2980 [Bacillus sp. ZZV12-4809]MCM3093594.1 DUF896 domain-containing protein [Cytobacillus sp. AMY 15.2]